MTYTRQPRYVASRRTTQQYPVEPLASPTPRTRRSVSGGESQSRSHGRGVHWLLPLGCGMLLLLVLYVLAMTAYIWGLDRYNDWTYGTTRTVHLDAVVGDHDSASHKTHFLGLNLHGHIEVLEFPGGDATHAKVFVGPQLSWSKAQMAVVTLEVKDVNHDGRPDLLVHIFGEPALFTTPPSFSYVLQNTRDGLKSPAQQPSV